MKNIVFTLMLIMSIGHAQTLTLSLNENNQGSYTCARLANNAPVLIVDMVIDSEYNVLLDGFAATISGSTESIQYSDITIWQNFGPERTEFASPDLTGLVNQL